MISKDANDKQIFKESQHEVRRIVTNKKYEQWKSTCFRPITYIGGKQSTECQRPMKNMKTNKTNYIVSSITAQMQNRYVEQIIIEKNPEFNFSENTDQTIITHGLPIRFKLNDIKKVERSRGKKVEKATVKTTAEYQSRTRYVDYIQQFYNYAVIPYKNSILRRNTSPLC